MKKSGGKKGIIISAIIIILVIVLLAGGVFAYLTTDLFKSEQTLFFKYMGEALESFEYVENTQITELTNKKEQNPYTLTGNLKFEKGEEIDEVNANILSNMDLQIEAKVNNPEEKAYAKANLNYQNENLFSLEYVNSNNIYALKSDEIVTAFLGVENSNLKVLAQKLGIIDTKTIPDEIKQTNLNELLSISDEDKQHIKETYLSVLINVISQNNFKKEKNVEVQKEGVNYITTAYSLSLNSEELKQVKIAVLQALKEDSITLNLLATKAKLLGLDENYTQINNLGNTIQTKINEINNENNDSELGLKIIVYTNNQEVIMTEINYMDIVKYIIYGETKENISTRTSYGETEENISNKTIIIEDLKNSQNNIKIDLKETRNNHNQSNYNFLININNNIEINAIIDEVVGKSTIKTNCEVVFSQLENVIFTTNYEQEINFEEQTENIIELNTNNCGILNNYTTEQLQVLMQSISQRIETIINEKMQKIGWKQGMSLEDVLTSASQNDIKIEQNTDNTNNNNQVLPSEINTIEITNEINTTNEITSISNDVNETNIRINEIPNSGTNRIEANNPTV